MHETSPQSRYIFKIKPIIEKYLSIARPFIYTLDDITKVKAILYCGVF